METGGFGLGLGGGDAPLERGREEGDEYLLEVGGARIVGGGVVGGGEKALFARSL